MSDESPIQLILNGVIDAVLPFLILGLVILAAIWTLVAVLWFLRRTRDHRPRDTTYRAVESLLTPAERSFFSALLEAVDESQHIFVKVRLIDLIEVHRGVPARQAHMNRVMAKHVDFVLCDRSNLRPTLVIELDDASHQRRDRRERDEFVDSALADAGIPILHVRVAATYSLSELRRDIRAQVGGGTPSVA